MRKLHILISDKTASGKLRPITQVSFEVPDDVESLEIGQRIDIESVERFAILKIGRLYQLDNLIKSDKVTT